MAKASTPEPAPKRGGREVTPLLITTLKSMGYSRSIALVEARHAFGVAKYGQGLMTGDGRDDIEDLEQELGDAIQYAFKARLNGTLTPEVQQRLREHLDALELLMGVARAL